MNKFDVMKNIAKEITVGGLPFMSGKDKLEVEGAVLNSILTVDEYGYMESTNDEGKKEEYIVISLKEYPNSFIYGSSVVTDSFKKLEQQMDNHGYEISELLEEGLTFKLTKVKSKNKRTYTKIEFFPNN